MSKLYTTCSQLEDSRIAQLNKTNMEEPKANKTTKKGSYLSKS